MLLEIIYNSPDVLGLQIIFKLQEDSINLFLLL
jgi:hypothetical protein